MVGIAFHVDELAPLGVGDEAATHSAEGADGSGDLGVLGFGGMYGAGPPSTPKNDVREAQSGNSASQTLDKSSASDAHIPPRLWYEIE
jgi:hypothetical protein